MCLGSGCKGCTGCNGDQVQIQVPTQQPQAANPLGLPPPLPHEVVITPDSPDEQLAEHYGVTVDEIKRLKALHVALPGITRPTGVPDPERVPKPSEARVESPETTRTATRADTVMGGPQRVTQIPAFKIIVAAEMPAQRIVPPADVFEAVKRLRHVLFGMKLPVFSRPVAFIDSTLDGPDAATDFSVGLPVPIDFRVPHGMKVREFQGGKGLFANHIVIDEIFMTEENWRVLTSPEVRGLLPAPCTIAVVIPFDEMPTADRQAAGNGFFYCR